MSFSVYTGKSADNSRVYDLGEKVVLFLTETFQCRRYCLFMDKFFSSVQLCQTLLLRNTYVCGTIWANHKDYPTALKDTQLAGRGEFLSAVVKDNVNAIVWKD